jgi:hypothetical protein
LQVVGVKAEYEEKVKNLKRMLEEERQRQVTTMKNVLERDREHEVQHLMDSHDNDMGKLKNGEYKSYGFILSWHGSVLVFS